MECCVSIELIKYIHKYIYKGHNCTTIQLAQAGQMVNDFFFDVYINAHYIYYRGIYTTCLVFHAL